MYQEDGTRQAVNSKHGKKELTSKTNGRLILFTFKR